MAGLTFSFLSFFPIGQRGLLGSFFSTVRFQRKNLISPAWDLCSGQQSHPAAGQRGALTHTEMQNAGQREQGEEAGCTLCLFLLASEHPVGAQASLDDSRTIVITAQSWQDEMKSGFS